MNNRTLKIRDIHEIAVLLLIGRTDFEVAVEGKVVFVLFDDTDGKCSQALREYASGELIYPVTTSFSALQRARDIVLGEKRLLNIGG